MCSKIRKNIDVFQLQKSVVGRIDTNHVLLGLKT